MLDRFVIYAWDRDWTDYMHGQILDIHRTMFENLFDFSYRVTPAHH